jgi:hypothetical protein
MDAASSETVVCQLKQLLRTAGLRLVRMFGSRIIDQRTGATLGRALVLPWRGKLHVIGLETPVQVTWQPQKRLTYWKQEIGFATHPPVDFPNARSAPQRSAKQPESE